MLVNCCLFGVGGILLSSFLVMDLSKRSYVLMHHAGSKHDAAYAGVDMLAMGGEEVCMGSQKPYG